MKTVALLTLLAMSTLTAADPAKIETAIVGGGCFWCTEGTYKLVPGVTKIVSGYSAGKTENPTYEDICTGESGHAEVVKVSYDAAVISYRKILDLFFDMHDPTSVTKEEMVKHGKLLPKGTPYQGNDYGTQYRSIIIYETEAQKKDADAAKAEAQKNWKDPIATEKVLAHVKDSHQADASLQITPQEVVAIMKANRKTLLLDVRTREEHEAVALPGAQ